MPPPQINILNCLVLQSKVSLKYIPQEIQIYYVNSKRRFLVYFRFHEQMIEAMRLLTYNNARFYRRESLLPDREEQQQLVFHCNYRFKRIDLRRSIYHSTPYNEPKLLFDKYDRAKTKYEQAPRRSQTKITEPEQHEPIIMEQKLVKQRSQNSLNGYRFKNEEAKSILQNKQMLNNIFFYLSTLSG